MLAGGDQVGGLAPALGGERLVVLEIIGVPGEPVTDRQPVDAELPADLLLADLPVAALDELHDGHPPSTGDAAHHHTERRRALALAVSGVDDHDRWRRVEAVGPGIFGRGVHR